MKYLLAPVFLLYKLWIGIVFWFTLVLLYPVFYILLSKEKWYPIAFEMKKFWSILISFLIFCPIRAKYKADLPKRPYIICSNHSSYLDTVFMYSIFSDYFLFVGKGELLKWPLFRMFFKTMNIPVHRNNSRKAFNALQKAYEAIERKECVAIYPEGTIPNSAPKMKLFKNGAFRMAVDKQVPVVPVTWLTNYLIMKDPGKIFSYSLPKVVRVIVHAPIHPTGTGDEDVSKLRNAVFAAIDSALPEEFRKHHGE
ncbi:MAG: lysophospholipid acyltransferase family protein [Flavobacteriales bacterium]|nr:lysophospholipid acyltransferase family protein [Flavobacteriales bacterium]